MRADFPIGIAQSTRREEPEMLARERWQAKTISVLERVFEERCRQVARYGHNEDLEDGFGPEMPWLRPANSTMSARRVQEAFREDYERHESETGRPTWMHLIREELAEMFESDPDDPATVEEALQVAALLVSWAEKKL
jgi:hypothetical protein